MLGEYEIMWERAETCCKTHGHSFGSRLDHHIQHLIVGSGIGPLVYFDIFKTLAVSKTLWLTDSIMNMAYLFIRLEAAMLMFLI